jgi:lysophospholipase L1-like esterase
LVIKRPKAISRWARALRALACLALAGLVACGGGGGGPASPPVASATPTPVTVTRIMPLGDSITQANEETNSYRRPLWKRLAPGRFDFVGSLRDNHLGPPPDPDFDLDHEGHWGWRADQVLAEIGGWAAIHRPDVVLLHLGSNDVFAGQSTSSTLGELGAIVERLRGANPRVTVLLAQLIPTSRGAQTGIDQLNAGIPGLAAQLDASASRVIVVDQSAGFDPVTDTRDGIHPNAAGEEKIAAAWHAALMRLLPESQRARTTAASSAPGPLGLTGPVAEDRAVRESPPRTTPR